jgi:hypothetical protein
MPEGVEMPTLDEHRFGTSHTPRFDGRTRELDQARSQSTQTLRRVLGQWDGLASLKDEIRRVEVRIKSAETTGDKELSSLKAYLKGLRYSLDCRAFADNNE